MRKLRAFLAHHPRVANWCVLSVGMVAMLLWASHGKGLSGAQTAWLSLASVGLAGACAWIIGWDILTMYFIIKPISYDFPTDY